MVKFVSTRDYLIPGSYIRWHSWTSASLRRLYIGQFLSIHFKDRDEDVLSKGSKDILHEYFHAPWTYQMTLLVSLWFLFCFVFIWDESVTSSFNQKYQKSFYSYDKNKLFSYDIIRGIQQARSISFFILFWGINEGLKRKHILHSLVADQSTGFLARSRVPPQRINSREIG